MLSLRTAFLLLLLAFSLVSALGPSNFVATASQHLRWSKVSSITSYVLVDKVPGRSDYYHTVTPSEVLPGVLEYDPQDWPGYTVRYGVRTDVAGSDWASPEVTITFTTTTTVVQTTSPPSTTASVPTNFVATVGNRLLWSKVSSITSYVLVDKVPGRSDYYHTVTPSEVLPGVLEYDPQDWPGYTVSYGVRTNVAGSNWASPEVTITYPIATTTVASTTSPPTASVTPTHPPSGAWPRVGSICNQIEQSTARVVIKSDGVKNNRFEVILPASIPEAQQLMLWNMRDLGIRPLPVFQKGGDYGNNGPWAPSSTDADSGANWMAYYGPGGDFYKPGAAGYGLEAFAPDTCEAMNEISYSYRNQDSPMFSHGQAEAYADFIARLRSQLNAKPNGYKIRILADLGTSTGTAFVSKVFAKQPNLWNMIGGVALHTYGPKSRWQPIVDGPTNFLHSRGLDLFAKGVWVTECGVANEEWPRGNPLEIRQGTGVDNYGWQAIDPSPSHAQAAQWLRQSYNDHISYLGSALKMYMLFQHFDQKAPSYKENGYTQRERTFGCRHECYEGYSCSDKYEFTTECRRLLALSANVSVARADAATPSSPAGPSRGLIVGSVVVGCVLAAAALMALAFWMLRSRSKSMGNHHHPQEPLGNCAYSLQS